MRNRLLFALFLMGFTSLVVQVLSIREFLICFYGNELSIGLVLGNWILFEAIGSSLFSRFSQASRRPLIFYCLLQCSIALYFPVAVYLIRSAKSLLALTAGEAVGIVPVFVFSLLILAPLSIFDGAQFPLGCRLWKDYTKKPVESVGNVYIFEAIGFILAGPIFTYILITRLQSFSIAIIISLLNLSSGLFLVQKEAKFLFKKIIIIFILAALCIGGGALFSNVSELINNSSLRKQWRGYTLIDSKNSIYGNIAVTKQEEQYTFFSDGIPIITTPLPDVVLNEEFIHFGMLAHPAPKDVLIVGGGAGGPIYEILKHPIRHLDYAELDPLLIKMLKDYPSDLTQQELNDPRVSIKIADGARYIKTTQAKYDIVFANLPLPITLQLNRFYTEEFFGSVKNVLKDERSMLVFNLPGSLSYLNPELEKLNLSVLDTLKDTFSTVEVIPGDFNLFLASRSDFSITAQILNERLEKRKISTRLLNPLYIEYRLSPQWSEWFHASLARAPEVKENTSFLPMGLFYGLSYWNTLFSPYLDGFFRILERTNLGILLIPVISFVLLIFILSLFIGLLKRTGLPYAILTTGFLGLTFELILIFIYQSFYGYVYHHIGLLITAFMAGLTLGGWLITRRLSKMRNKKLLFLLLESGMVMFSLAVLPLLIYVGKSNLNLSFFFFVLSAISGFLVGSEFPLANSLYQSGDTTRTAGLLYSLDLAGSWIGALIVSVVLLPVIGLVGTCVFLAILKLSSLLLVSVFRS